MGKNKNNNIGGDRSGKKRTGNAAQAIQKESVKKDKKQKLLECYYCGKLVKANAIKCKYCGKWYSAGKRSIALGIFMVAIIIVLAFLLLNYLDGGQSAFVGGPDGGPPDLNFDDWETLGDVSIPDDDPDIMGRIGEQYDVYSFSIMTRDRTAQTSSTHYVQADENTNVFLMDMETETVTQGTVYDIASESGMLQVWGTQNADGSWQATDLSIMTGMPDRVRP